MKAIRSFETSGITCQRTRTGMFTHTHTHTHKIKTSSAAKENRVVSARSSYPFVPTRTAPPVQLTDSTPSCSGTHIVQSGRNIYTGNGRPAVVFTLVFKNCCVLANYAVQTVTQRSLFTGKFPPRCVGHTKHFVHTVWCNLILRKKYIYRWHYSDYKQSYRLQRQCRRKISWDRQTERQTYCTIDPGSNTKHVADLR